MRRFASAWRSSTRPNRVAPVGQASTQPGSWPSARRWLQSSHLRIFPAALSSSYFGTWNGQAKTQ